MSVLNDDDRDLVHALRERYNPANHVHTEHVRRGPARVADSDPVAAPPRRPRPLPRRTRCVYCGRASKGALACFEHRDLPRLDPMYAQDLILG